MTQNVDFYARCYALLAQVPKGKVTTYQAIAKGLGSLAYRAVGTAMAKNDRLIIRPCHRVVRSDGSIGQYALGAEKKIALLLQEGIEIADGKVVCMERYMHRF